jgi:hypothetical protein
MLRPAVGKVIAIDRSDDDVGEAEIGVASATGTGSL